MTLVHVVGARPNFMKVAPVMAALGRMDHFSQQLVHTGQHYDANMSGIFFQQLGMTQPDVNLEVGSGSHSVQTAQIMVRFEEALPKLKPDRVVVYGDVNSTVATAMVCAKHGIPVAHVEAGLRSYDRSMPEEINRLLTDQIAELLFTPSRDGNENLLKEGIDAARIHLVGNVMIDTLIRLLPKAQVPRIDGLDDKFALVTLHRPSNVDDPNILQTLMTTLLEISRDIQVLFPVHPRTRHRLEQSGLLAQSQSRLLVVNPLGYLEFLALQKKATLVVTDSGGIQEETTFLGIPCLTVRENTERPVTVEIGTNILVGKDMSRLKSETSRVLQGKAKRGRVPPLWDGKASERIADILAKRN